MKCRPVTYGVIEGSRIEHGFRCKHILWSRFHTEEDRDQAMKKHRKSLSKTKGKS